MIPIPRRPACKVARIVATGVMVESSGFTPEGSESNDGSEKSSSFARLFVLLAQFFEFLTDADLESPACRLVEARRIHALGEVALAGREGVFLVVRVAVALGVAEVLHEARRGIAQMQRYGSRAVLLHEGARRVV